MRSNVVAPGPAPGLRGDPVVARLRSAGCVRAEDEALLLRRAARSPEALEALVTRRVAGEPLEHVVGWAEVGGVRVRLGPGVFVPRRRSEHLVAVAAGLIARRPDTGPLTVLDLCAGSGALGLAVHRAAGPFDLLAVELDPVAARWAALNLAPIGARVLVGDLFGPIPGRLAGHVALVIGNAPYVPTAELARMPREAREHEPSLALDGGADGLAVHRRLLARAGDWLRPGGAVVVELTRAQVGTVRALSARVGLDVTAVPDEADPATVVVVATRGR